MKRAAKKPKILSDKIKLANLIKKHWSAESLDAPPHKAYWRGLFVSPSGQLRIWVTFQLYVRKIGVDYVRTEWMNDGMMHKALRVDEIKTLLNSAETPINKR